MKSFLSIGNKYLKKSTWRDLSVTKFCLFSMGLFVGTTIREKDRKAVRRGAAAVFAVTYAALMGKVLKVIKGERSAPNKR